VDWAIQERNKRTHSYRVTVARNQKRPKDQLLVVKNHEIKNSTLSRQIQILTEQNKKFQHEVNEAIAKAEGLDRELHTQKEILKQMELTKKEYIDKLKDELQIIEKRYLHLINSNSMLGEDYRS